MATLGSLVVSLQADTVRFNRDLGRASRIADKKAKAMKKTFTRLAGAIGASFAGISFGRLIIETTKSIDTIGKLSIRLGISTEALSQLQHAAEISGISVQTMNLGLQRMVRRVSEVAVGTGEAKKAMEELGISADKMIQLAPEKQFEAIAEALSEVENNSDKVRLAMKFFDTEGVALLQLMENGAGGIRAMREEADRLGITITQAMADRARLATDAMTRMEAVGRSLAIVFAESLGPSIIFIAESLQTTVQWIGKTIDGFRGLSEKVNLDNLREDLAEAGDEVTRLFDLVDGGATGGINQNQGRYKQELEAARADFEAVQERIRAVEALRSSSANVGQTVTVTADTTTFDDLIEKLRIQNEYLSFAAVGAKDYGEQLKAVNDAAKTLGVENLDEDQKTAIQDQIILRKALNSTIKQNSKDQQLANSHAASAAGAVTNFFKDAVTSGKKFSDLLKGLVAQLLEVALQKFILDQIFNTAFALFGGSIPGFANGTHSAPGGLAVVGERGPELVNLPRGSQVTPNHRLGMGGGTTVQVINNSGAEASVEQSNGPNGDELVKIFIGAAAESIATGGPLSSAIQSSFGTQRQGAFR